VTAEPAGATPPLAAEAAFQAAQLCVRRKQFLQAERFARHACEHDRGSAEYLALHAWVRVQSGELSSPARASQIMAALNRAVLKERASVSIRFYRAQALKRLGQHDAAYKDFVFVARRQPGNLDAMREVRLHQMRVRNKQKTSGVFSRLFLR
jgi:tetratricopeptide (TPR) repeat protein